MSQGRDFQDREPRPYQAPEIDAHEGLTYGKWGGLAVIYGVNVPFLSKLARGIVDEHGCFLWSSPTLVLTLAEASDAFHNKDEARNDELLRAAVSYCNEFLPPERALALDTRLRLTWARYGVVTVTCEFNRQKGYYMDVVKHGPDTEIIIAPRDPSDAPIRSRVDDDRAVFFATGEEKPQRQQREPRQARSNRGGYGGRNNSRGGFVG
jgi:hypothetical protein